MGQRFSRLFLFVLIITAVAKGGAFLPAYSIDDYLFVLRDFPSLSMLRQGRFGQAVLLQILHLIQLEPNYARVFFVSFALIASSLLAALVVRHWHVGRAGWLPVAAASVVATHPFTTEIFTFRTALGISMWAFALLALLLVPLRWSLAGLLGGAVIFALALSIYQVVLNYCLMIILISAAIGLTRLLVVGSAAGWPARVTSLLSLRRAVRHRTTALLACATLGTIIYLVTNAVIVRALRITMASRTQFLSPDRIGERVEAVWQVVRYRFLEVSPLLGRFLKGLLLLLLVTALAGLMARMRPWLRPWPLLLLLTVVSLLAVSLIWTVGVIVILEEFWAVPRVMAHVGIFWAGILVISHRCSSAGTRPALGVLSLLIVLSFIGSSNRILHDQIRLNARDMSKATRILARLESLPGFSGTELVAVQGTPWSYPLSYTTLDRDMNISAFGARWSKVAILREVSGYDLKPAEDDAQQATAEAYCRGARPWPGPDSVTLKDGLAIVCLGIPH